LLTSSMREAPVAGWTTTVKELELPPGTVVRPIGSIGDRGIFLGITGEGWWLLGLDVASGRRLFGPVRLGPAGDASDFDCFVNGPRMVLCVRQERDPNTPATAWVVDNETGAVTFAGPTDVRVAAVPGRPRLEQLGDYAIAEVEGQGVRGLGPHGELTWFVPGDGILTAQFTMQDRDYAPPTLAVQGSGGVADVVFSVIDGRVVKPSLPQDVQLGRAVVYPGGFGYQYTTADGVARVAFFDDTGKMLGEPESGDTLETRSPDVPIVAKDSNRTVFNLDGRRLVDLPRSAASPDGRRIGSRLFIATDADHRQWQQFDLRTGEAGKTCEGDGLGPYYIASDGAVAVALGERTLLEAVDLTTCETLWSLPGPAPNEAKEIWKVNTTLVQRTDDRLFSLVAPP
ncbi:MAG: hypothetical protein QOI28_2734, partial [Mycobacterium sp.]|nr:hypothetical protein [Mycobacterium sp.]